MFNKSDIPIKDMIVPGLLPSRAQRAIYRRRGYRIAGDVELAPGAVIEADEVSIGSGSSIGMGCVLRGRSIVIGRGVKISAFCIFEGRDFLIGDDTTVREQVFIGGPLMPDSRLKLGRRVHIFHSCFLNPSRPLSIGDDTGVGGRSSIFTHGSWQNIMKGYPVAFEPVSIGREVWLPWHVFILPGVVIGDGATIGAGSVVNRSIPEGVLAAGVPAKVLRQADSWPQSIDDDQRWRICRDVTMLMSTYFDEQGAPVRIAEDTANRIQLVLDVDGQTRCIEVVRDPESAQSSDLLVSLRLPSGEQLASKRTCLSLVDRRRAGLRDALSREVESFWGRYGLRFVDAAEPRPDGQLGGEG
jgi:acetyltransferase-like isoleucine patch superfamily enzyme